MASNSKKTLFTVNSIISTVILSLVLISAHRYQTEAIIIPTDNEESSKSMDKNELSLSHRPGGNYFLVDDTNYPIVDSLGQTMPIKRSWNNLRGSWGKRSVDSALYAGTNSFYADGGNDEYADLMLLLNQPYFRTAEIADMSRSAERENNLNDINDMTKQRNEQKRAWTGFSNYWPIRFNSRNSANRNNGGYGKREPAWNNLKGLWGKRSWNSLQASWGKRAAEQSSPDTSTSSSDDKLNYY